MVGRLEAATGRTASFATGPGAAVDAVIWAMGYRDDTEWVDLPQAKDANGRFVQGRGLSPVPGLFFIGRPWQWTQGSAILTGVGADAAYVTEQLRTQLLERDRHRRP